MHLSFKKTFFTGQNNFEFFLLSVPWIQILVVYQTIEIMSKNPTENNNSAFNIQRWGVVITVFSTIGITIMTNPDVVKGVTNTIIEVFNENNEHKKNDKEILKQFEVNARSKTGKMYTYPENEQPAELEYKAEGKWTAIPLYIIEGNIPRGETDADGYKDIGFNSNDNKPCPNRNTAALVILDENGQCLDGGKFGSFQATPGDEYRFIMNDNHPKYDDNEGTIEVTLSKKNKRSNNNQR